VVHFVGDGVVAGAFLGCRKAISQNLFTQYGPSTSMKKVKTSTMMALPPTLTMLLTMAIDIEPRSVATLLMLSEVFCSEAL
jgi:hypothetical protein